MVVLQVAQDLSQTTQAVPERAKPVRQPVQTVVEEQPEQPVGQTIGTPLTTAVATLVDGLFPQALEASKENPESQRVQFDPDVQAWQLLEQAEQTPAEM